MPFIIGLIIVALAMIYATVLVLNNKNKKSRNNIHFYVARDKNEDLWLYLGKPIRDKGGEVFVAKKYKCGISYSCRFNHLKLNADKYKNLKWEDSPIKVSLNLEN